MRASVDAHGSVTTSVAGAVVSFGIALEVFFWSSGALSHASIAAQGADGTSTVVFALGVVSLLTGALLSFGKL